MDDLEEHARNHSSHLAKTDADFRKEMMHALLEKNIPLAQTERFEIYREMGIPANVFKKLDVISLHEAMARRHMIMVNW